MLSTRTLRDILLSSLMKDLDEGGIQEEISHHFLQEISHLVKRQRPRTKTIESSYQCMQSSEKTWSMQCTDRRIAFTLWWWMLILLMSNGFGQYKEIRNILTRSSITYPFQFDGMLASEELQSVWWLVVIWRVFKECTEYCHESCIEREAFRRQSRHPQSVFSVYLLNIRWETS